MTRSTMRTAVLGLGLVGSFIAIAAGTWTVVSRVWSRSLTQTLEVAVAAPFVAVWVLAPLFWALRPRSDVEPEDEEGPVPLISALVMVLVAATVFIYDLVILPVVVGADLGLPSLVRLLVVPVVQWMALAVAGILQMGRHRPAP